MLQLFIVILNGKNVKNDSIHQRKFCNTRLPGYKFVISTENNHIFNLETLLFILTFEFETIRKLLIYHVLSELGF